MFFLRFCTDRNVKVLKCINRPLAQLLSVHVLGAGGLGFDSRAGQIGVVLPTARHRCNVSSELC